MIGKKQIEIKLDGVRVLTIIRKNKVEMFSRNGKQFHNFGHIISEIENVLKEDPAPHDLVLDGEVMSANFQDCLLYTSPSPRDRQKSRMPSSA